eukprot:4814546-Pyramimonas_sp.AAC.1
MSLASAFERDRSSVAPTPLSMVSEALAFIWAMAWAMQSQFRGVLFQFHMDKVVVMYGAHCKWDIPRVSRMYMITHDIF